VSQAGADSPRVISRFEANLLEILRFFLRKGSVERVARRILDPCEQPRCLSRAAVELVKDTLAKGYTSLLANGREETTAKGYPSFLTLPGGWRSERYLRGIRVAEGRLWQRTDPEELGLTFSRHTLDFLIWVTAAKLSDSDLRWWTTKGRTLTLGDQLLLYYAYGGLRQVRGGSVQEPGKKSVFAGNAICRLGYPGDFANAPADVEFSFGPWLSEPGSWILEALQGELASRWVAAEEQKEKEPSWTYMQAVGRTQGQAVSAFLDAIDGAGRRDLARFLLAALARLLAEGVTAERWLGGMKFRGTTIAERTETGRHALVALRQLGRLRQWAQEARGVAFFEENYAASQLYKADWEHWQGEALHARAEAILREVEPL
jgi:hypothetical protein